MYKLMIEKILLSILIKFFDYLKTNTNSCLKYYSLFWYNSFYKYTIISDGLFIVKYFTILLIYILFINYLNRF
jgi:hypothetical protein